MIKIENDFHFTEWEDIMQEYKTKQKEFLLECLAENKDVHMTVSDISAYMREKGHAMGMSTVYRQLDKLVSSGLVRKYIIDENSSACYQFADSQGGCCEHFHLKCSSCGKLIHTDCSLMRKIADHMRESHGFEVDCTKTLLYGTCSECLNKNKQ